MVTESAPTPRSSSDSPLGELSLALSGGGFRASAFHLGALSMLHQLGLAKSVTRVSTVSGGTLTGMAWALSLARGASFDEFEKSFTHLLGSASLVQDAYMSVVRGHSRTLIAGLARAYAHPDFLGEARLETLRTANTQLRDAVFNATEFRTGLAFRFPTRQGRVIGNGRCRVDAEIASRARLADIAAASSCFPGGFEPIVFPSDFVWNGPAPDLGSGFPIALMDGGIFDNQGLDALVFDREVASDPTGLVIISDATQEQEPLYEPAIGLTRGWVRVWHVLLVLFALLALSIATAIQLVVRLASGAATQRAVDASALALSTLGTAIVVYLGATLWRAMREFRGPPRFDPWRAALRLRVTDVIRLAGLRGRSLLALTSRVFMARIRRLVFEHLYAEEKFMDRRVSNLIYDLLPGRRRLAPECPTPSEALGEIVTRAHAMPTTLWFENQSELDDLVLTGRATMCLKLLDHVSRRVAKDPTRNGAALRNLGERLREAWAGIESDAATRTNRK